jgi:hypothetical protein
MEDNPNKKLLNLMEVANQISSGQYITELFDNPYKLKMDKISHPSKVFPSGSHGGGAQFKTDKGDMRGIRVEYARLTSGAMQLRVEFNAVKLIDLEVGTQYADDRIKMDGDVSKIVSTVYAVVKHYTKYLEPTSIKFSIKHEFEEEKVLKFIEKAINKLAKEEGYKAPKVSKTSKLLSFTIKTAKSLPKQFYIFDLKSRDILFGPNSYSECNKERAADHSHNVPYDEKKYPPFLGVYNPDKKKKIGDKMTDADLRNLKDKGVYAKFFTG